MAAHKCACLVVSYILTLPNRHRSVRSLLILPCLHDMIENTAMPKWIRHQWLPRLFMYWLILCWIRLRISLWLFSRFIDTRALNDRPRTPFYVKDHVGFFSLATGHPDHDASLPGCRDAWVPATTLLSECTYCPYQVSYLLMARMIMMVVSSHRGDAITEMKSLRGCGS